MESKKFDNAAFCLLLESSNKINMRKARHNGGQALDSNFPKQFYYQQYQRLQSILTRGLFNDRTGYLSNALIPTVTIFILIGRGSSLMINFDDIPSRRDRITYSIKYLVELQDFRPFLGK